DASMDSGMPSTPDAGHPADPVDAGHDAGKGNGTGPRTGKDDANDKSKGEEEMPGSPDNVPRPGGGIPDSTRAPKGNKGTPEAPPSKPAKESDGCSVNASPTAGLGTGFFGLALALGGLAARRRLSRKR